MKTYIKLLIACVAFGSATANAVEYTTGQAAALQAVKEAVAAGDEETLSEVVAEQVSAYPELAGDIVEIALRTLPIDNPLLKTVIQVASLNSDASGISAILLAIQKTPSPQSQRRQVGLFDALGISNNITQLISSAKTFGGVNSFLFSADPPFSAFVFNYNSLNDSTSTNITTGITIGPYAN